MIDGKFKLKQKNAADFSPFFVITRYDSSSVFRKTQQLVESPLL